MFEDVEAAVPPRDEPDRVRGRACALPRERVFVVCAAEPRRDGVAVVAGVVLFDAALDPPPVPRAPPVPPVPEEPVVWAMAPVARPIANAIAVIVKRINHPFDLGWRDNDRCRATAASIGLIIPLNQIINPG